MCEITAEESLEVCVSGCESWLSALQPPAGGAHTPAALSHEAKHHKTMCGVSPPAVQSCEEKTNKSVRFKVQPRRAVLIRSC